jgi:phage protein D
MMTAFLDAVRERIEAIRQQFETNFGNLMKLAEAA